MLKYEYRVCMYIVHCTLYSTVGFTKPKIFTLGVGHIAKSELSKFNIEYFGEIETEFDNT